MEIDVGTVVAGKYELVRLVGKGAMGEVWLARHETLGGDFAVKLVETAGDVEAASASGRFQLEAQIAAKLSRRTRHIVRVSDHGEENGIAYLVMELLDGESLEARLERSGPLDLAETAAIVLQVARALALAHGEGIFHRDLKPANIFLTKDEDGRLLVKLLDFGIARAVKPFKTRSPFATGKDMVLGTPSYMSPEQARGLDSLDHRCDLWALATCAYEALTTRIPFEGTTVEDVFLSICTFKLLPIASLRPDLGPEVAAFFEKAFAPKLDARFASAQELAAAFESLVGPSATPWNDDPMPAAVDTLAGAGLPKRKSGVVIGGSALAAAAVLALGLFALRAATTTPASASPASTALATGVASVAPPALPATDPPPVVAAAPENAAATAATTATTAPAQPPAVAKKDVHRAASPAGHAVTAAAPAPSPAPSPSPAPPPTPAPAPAKKGPIDKGEVF